MKYSAQKIHSNKLMDWTNRGVWYSANRVRERYSISKKTDFNFPNMAPYPPLVNRQMSLVLIYEASQRLRITVIIAIFCL